MDRKHFLITFIISVLLFSLVVFLIYVVYCFAFYDKNQEKTYIDSFNKRYYDFVYDHLENKDKIEKSLYNYTINLTFNRNRLSELFDYYYSGNKDEFINKYLINPKTDHIKFSYEGKTGLVKRRAILYNNIELVNSNGDKVNFGVRKDIKLIVQENDSLVVDELECAIKDDVCSFDYMMGGLHTVEYTSGKITYFGILNVSKDKQEITISNLDSLVKINEVKGETKANKVKNIDLKAGKYKETKCYLASDCANKKKSFLIINDDGTANLYMWYNLAQAGDSYFGTYEIKNNFLILKFNGHTYKEFDYDTKVTSTIDIDVYSEFRYKIENDHTINNEEYRFVLSE